MRTEDFGAELKKLGFSDFAGVPCSYLAPLINWAINENAFIMANNEGEAVAIASGISLNSLCNESQNFGVVLMQNSGLSNALSPLTSLNHTFNIPILGFISLRGEPNDSGENTDEPQHELLGKITDKLLQTCEIECAFLVSNFEVAKQQLSHAKAVLKSNKSFFFIVRNHCFEKVALTNSPILCHIERSEISQNNRDSSPTAQNDKIRHDAKPTRLQTLQIIQNLGQNCALLATTGKAGRELYELGDKENQLYMVGSMGCVSALGLGIALKSHKKIIAIDGDSALLMRLGALVGNAYYARCANKGNFCHILLDNQSHDSTGGQFNLSPFVDFVAIAKSCGYEVAKRAQNLDEFSEILGEFLEAQNGGAYFIYLDIAKGSKKDLGRPKITPKQVGQRFSAWLNDKEV
ncbi:phosphonopyruvate decarboxylase [Helicobacter sp. 23-1045]